MTEHDMQNEIERLRRELADVTNSRDRMREIVCAVLSIPPAEVLEREIEALMKQPGRGIEDLLEELQRDASPRQKQSIPA